MASAQDLFGQLWKEYALSDSRYMTSDTVVLCMETMTVVSGSSARHRVYLGRAQYVTDTRPGSFCGDRSAFLWRT